MLLMLITVVVIAVDIVTAVVTAVVIAVVDELQIMEDDGIAKMEDERRWKKIEYDR